MKTHWLYGVGPDKALKFKVEVDQETNCRACIHNHVCNHDMEDRCINYWTGGSEGRKGSCDRCIHHYTRWHKEAVPCFCCRDNHPAGGLVGKEGQNPLDGGAAPARGD